MLRYHPRTKALARSHVEITMLPRQQTSVDVCGDDGQHVRSIASSRRFSRFGLCLRHEKSMMWFHPCRVILMSSSIAAMSRSHCLYRKTLRK
nr:hypothetical protein CFP56_24260 [Quercus suber]